MLKRVLCHHQVCFHFAFSVREFTSNIAKKTLLYYRLDSHMSVFRLLEVRQVQSISATMVQPYRFKV